MPEQQSLAEPHGRTPAPADAGLGVLVQRGEQRVAALGLAAEPGAAEALEAALQRLPLTDPAAAPDAATAADPHASAATASTISPRLFDALLPGGAVLGVTLMSQAIRITLVRPVGSEGRTLFDFVAAVPFAFDILEQILNDPYQGITVADHTGTIRYISPVHEKFLGLGYGGGIGKPAEEAIPNSRLRAVIASGKAEIGKPQRFGAEVTRVVNRRPVRRQGQIVGAVGQVMFRDTQAVSQMAAEMDQLRSQLAQYRRELDGLRGMREALAELVGDSQAMQRLRHEIGTVARLDVPVLILGESGTGKELVARAIHTLGRPAQPMVSLNLAALPATLIEAELFGHAAGAFTGSSKQGRAGKFEQANDGTLFLDEVGDIPMEVQIKLLRVLEERLVQRLGSHATQRATFRLVAATHRDIDALITSGAFRHDLFYRISGVTLRLPPLRHRLEDIPALLNHFVAAFCQRNGLPPPRMAADVARYLADQPWPGNLRQLRHRIEEALVFSPPGQLTLDAFARNEAVRSEQAAWATPAAARAAWVAEPVADAAPPPATGPVTGPAPAPPPSSERLKDHDRVAARRMLDDCGGNKKRAAERLGISRSYLYKLLG